MKKVCSLLLSLILVISLAIPAYAVGSTVIFKGSQEKISFDVQSGYTSSDLFDNFKDVMPGDRLSETITIKNNAWGYDYIKVYLRAIAHDEQNNPLTYSGSFERTDGKDQDVVAGSRDETVATMSDFLSKLTMRVYDGNELIYAASPDELDGLKKNVYLGSVNRLRSINLRVELDVPIELGNEYANRVGEVDWVFTVEAHNHPTDMPKTGDYVIIGASAIMVASGAMLVLLFVLKRKKKKE